ncbi:MFS transporter [Micromonospora sp. MA102]|uniref:MFS transporter n=1 Tax=Micromonospora sp. MA102 TaxID=2952755 RepID=UPI0021C77359|nr:MFS transporter [Micromonospora sp. MA102]
MGALIGLAGGTFLYTAAEALPIGLLLPMAVDLAVSPSQVGMLVTVYGAVVMVASVPLTALMRKVPRRRLLSALLAGFVVSNAITVFASTLTMLMAARIATAVTHALFWAVVVPTAAELFRPGLHGRVVAVVFAGGNVALVLGVPAGTWLGQRAGWRASFLAVAGLGVIVFAMVAWLLPSTGPLQGHASRGRTPDSCRFWLLVAVAVLSTAGAIAAYTYIALFITEVSGLPASSIGTVLLARGVASVLGILAAGPIVDRSPWSALVATVALQCMALLGLYAFGHQPAIAIVLIAIAGLGFAAFTAALGGLVLQVAPGRSDLAAATLSAAVNVGITGGAFLGGLTLGSHGAHSTMLLGAVLAAVALTLTLGERLVPPPRRKHGTATPEPVSRRYSRPTRPSSEPFSS